MSDIYGTLRVVEHLDDTSPHDNPDCDVCALVRRLDGTPATEAQAEASVAAGESGIFLVDTDGQPISLSGEDVTWSGPTVHAWVDATPGPALAPEPEQPEGTTTTSRTSWKVQRS